MAVLDSNIIVKLFDRKEEHFDKADKLFSDIKSRGEMIYIPALAILEVSQALKRKGKSQLQILENLNSIKPFCVVAIGPITFEDDLVEVLAVAFRRDISVYDATFVHLAQKLGIDFWTHDRRLLTKTKGLRFVRDLRSV